MANHRSLKSVVLATALASLAGVSAGTIEYDYAQVDEVRELTRVVEVAVPREECWEQPVTVYQPTSVPYSYTPTIVGGIVGAVVGRQFGSGSGRDWATVAGTTLGASVGRDYGYRRHYAPAPVVTSAEERCRVVNDYDTQERLDGFLVKYTYNGRQYETRTASHPGDRIKVRVEIQPVQ